jgi:hypothetical protein
MAPSKQTSRLDLGDYLPYLVNRVGSIIADQFGEEALTPHGLSIAMWRVMAALASTGGQRQIDLADLTSIDSSTLSRRVSPVAREFETAAIADLSREELMLLKRCLRRIYGNMQARPAASNGRRSKPIAV